MRRAVWLLVGLVVLVGGIDRVQWYTGRVPLSNMARRSLEGAPELRIRGGLLTYHGTYAIDRAYLKPVGTTDQGVTYFRVHDWPEGMPGGWLYIPKSDGVSYRYADPRRPGVVG